jgi:hypothetical protein
MAPRGNGFVEFVYVIHREMVAKTGGLVEEAGAGRGF